MNATATRVAIPQLNGTPRLSEVPEPCYTSYPGPDRFVEAFGAAQYAQALRLRADGLAGTAPVSVYVHLPFCGSLRSNCAGTQVVTRNHERGAEYLDLLRQEIQLHTAVLGSRTPLSSVYLGGGMPTFLRDAELERLLQMLRAAFRFEPGVALAIEVDPRTIDRARLAQLAAIGFNRVGFGVQDSNPRARVAARRAQTFDRVAALLRAAHELAFVSVHVDLIYGMPHQTVATFADTVSRLAALRPSQIALVGYAHRPQRFKAQRRIDGTAVPGAASRSTMLAESAASLLRCGYVGIGMNHFALPGNELAVAKRQGRLQRSLHGYTARAENDVIGLGVSAIGCLGATYSQNARRLDEYRDALHQGVLPTARGLALTRDDLLRRAVIMALLCQGRVDLEAIATAHLVDPREVFCEELTRLAAMAQRGLVRLTEDAIEVTSVGSACLCDIATVFDRHRYADARRADCARLL
ncbi:MAG: oxygen-independent coproporphyrinogen III oxidase [Pseudomonadota bacterium]|nr:oxygen-independent coproporphyrinogen III oxidase [Pseudomonadota bacterium]